MKDIEGSLAPKDNKTKLEEARIAEMTARSNLNDAKTTNMSKDTTAKKM